MTSQNMHHCKFEVPEIIFGRGLLSQVGSCAHRLGGKKVLLVSDQGLFRAGWVDVALKSLLNEGLECVYYDQVTPNPKDYEVEAGAALYLSAGADVIVGVGGGASWMPPKGLPSLCPMGPRFATTVGPT